MQEVKGFGGYQQIHDDLMAELRQARIAPPAQALGLELTPAGEALVPFLGLGYLVSPLGVRRADGGPVAAITASVLIRYLLTGSQARPSGQFVTLAALAGPLFSQGGYSASALEEPIRRRFQGRAPELARAVQALGGGPGGEGGLGSLSLVLEPLPHIRLQLVFYDRDEEFPARATLLFDSQATRVLDFETLAVMVTILVKALTKGQEADAAPGGQAA